MLMGTEACSPPSLFPLQEGRYLDSPRLSVNTGLYIPVFLNSSKPLRTQTVALISQEGTQVQREAKCLLAAWRTGGRRRDNSFLCTIIGFLCPAGTVNTYKLKSSSRIT